jgi:CRP-like cAMP-binding protein
MVAKFLAALEQACPTRIVAFETGQPVFRQGQAVRWLFVVVDGRVRLSRILSGGTEIALARVGNNEILAEASVFSARYHCDAIAEKPSSLRRFSMRDVLALLDRHTGMATSYGAYLAGRLMDLRATVEIRGIRRADDRLLAWLQFRAVGNPPIFDGEGSWPNVARQIGLTGESLYRALASLEREARIKRNGRKVILPERS